MFVNETDLNQVVSTTIMNPAFKPAAITIWDDQFFAKFSVSFFIDNGAYIGYTVALVNRSAGFSIGDGEFAVLEFEY